MPNAARSESPELLATVEIPFFEVAEYHRPYVAVWIQDSQRRAVANMAVWYQSEASGQRSGAKWLADLRQWWRRSGRTLDLPIDGVSGATRPSGTHQIKLSLNDSRLRDLPDGTYEWVVEAVREVGGREILSIPFTWPLEPGFSKTQFGTSELGKITLNVTP